MSKASILLKALLNGWEWRHQGYRLVWYGGRLCYKAQECTAPPWPPEPIGEVLLGYPMTVDGFVAAAESAPPEVFEDACIFLGFRGMVDEMHRKAR